MTEQRRRERSIGTQLLPSANDLAIGAAVERSLSNAEATTSRRVNDFAVTVRDGRVELRGHVTSTGAKQQVEQIASQTCGVLSVDNQLVADNELESAVAHVLISAPAGHEQRLYVNVRQGVVDLSGRASTATARDDAEQCAATVSNVRAVVNHMAAANAESEAVQPRVVQPLIGQEVIGKDMSLGRVEMVIINPRNRRVSAIVVHGNFPDWEQVTRRMLPDDMPQRKRRVVIPMSAVFHVNHDDVLLSITGVAAAHGPEFDAALFASADASWLPPYPYNAADMLLELPEASAA